MAEDFTQAIEMWGDGAATAAALDSGANADEAAKSLQISRETGAPAAVIDADHAGWAEQHQQQKNAATVRANPALTDYVNTVPLASKVSNDDYEKLDDLHKKLLQITKSVGEVSAQRDSFGTYGDEIAKGAQMGATSELYGQSAAVSHDTGLGAERTARLREKLKLLQVGEGGVSRIIGSGVGSLIADFVTGGLPGSVAGPFGTIAGMSAAGGIAAYGRHLDEMDQAAPDASETAKQLGAGIIGVATGVLNMVGLRGPGAALVTGAVREGVMQALPRLGLEAAKGATLGAGIGAVLQETSDIITDATKPSDGPTIFNSEERRQEVIGNIKRAAIEGAAFMGAFHTFGVGSNMIADRVAISRADQAAEQHKAAMDAADAAATKGRSPEALQAFVEKSVGDRTISIPAAKVLELRADEYLRPLVADFDEQMSLGLESGGDVTIPYGAYLAGVEGSIDSTLAKDLRHTPEGLTKTEGEDLANQIKGVLGEPAGEVSVLPDEHPASAESRGIAARTGAELRIPNTLSDGTPRPKEPPVPAGHKRFYHGGSGDLGDISALNDLWVTPHYQYARDYRSGDTPNNVWYVDIPEDQTGSLGVKDEINNLYMNGKLPAEWARTAQPLEAKPAGSKPSLLDALFPKPEDANMTRPQLDRYAARLQEHQDHVNEVALEAARKEVARRESTAWKDAVADIHREVAAATAARPEWRAHDFIVKRTLDGEKIPENVPSKLDREAVARYTDEPLPRGSLAKGGADPEEMASLFGFRTGADLVHALARLEKDRGDLAIGAHRKALIETETARRMDAEHGLFSADLEEEARRTALHQTAEDLLSTELKAIGDQIGAPTFDIGKTRDYARAQINQMTVRAARGLKALFRQIGNAGRKAEMALLKATPDYVTAFKAKQEQLMSHLLASEAERFDREATKALKRFEKLRKKATHANIDQRYTNQIHGLLNAMGVGVKRKSGELGEALQAESLVDFASAMKNQNSGVMVSPILFGLKAKKLGDITTEEFRALADAVKSIEKAGRDEKKVFLEGKEFDRQVLKKEVLDQINTLPSRFRAYEDTRRGKVRAGANKLFSPAMIFEELMNDLDRNNPKGVFNRLFRQLMIGAKNTFNDLTLETAKRLPDYNMRRAQDSVVNDLFHDPVDGQLYKMTRGDAMIVALNMGSKSNMERLTKGYKVDEASVRTWLNRTLRPEDVAWINGIWDYHEWLYPQLKAKALRTTGIAPDKVEATSHGDLKGGYFPVMRDPHSKGTMETEQDNAGQITWVDSTPAKGHFKSRVDGAQDIIQIKHAFGRYAVEVKKQLHDLAMGEPLIEFKKIFMDRDVRLAIKRTAGPGVDAEIPRFIEYAAGRHNISNKELAAQQALLGTMRRNLSQSVLTYNVNVFGSPNLGNIVSSVARVSTHPFELMNWLYQNPHALNYINERSQELKHWDTDWNREAQETLTSLEGDSRFKAKAIRFGYHLAATVEKKMAQLQWYADFQHARRRGENEGTAVALADKGIRENFHRASIVGLSQLMRSNHEYVKALTLFYGYGSLIFNRVHRMNNLAKQGGREIVSGNLVAGTRDFSKAFGIFVAHVIVPAFVFGPMFMGGKKEDESWAQYAAKLLAGQGALAVPIPGARDFLAYAIQGYSPRGTVIAELGKSIYNLGDDIARGLGIHDKPVSKTWLKNAFSVAGGTLGVPGAGQAGKSSQFLWNWWDGTDVPESTLEITRGLAHGKSKETVK